MELIENLLGIAPDGGNGTLEMTLAAVAAGIVAAVLHFRRVTS